MQSSERFDSTEGIAQARDKGIVIQPQHTVKERVLLADEEKIGRRHDDAP